MFSKKKQNKNENRKQNKKQKKKQFKKQFNLATIDFKKQLQKTYLIYLFFGFQID